MKISKVKLLVRIIEILIIVASIRLTPIAIKYANAARGYEAVGGEYLIPMFAFLIIILIETIIEMVEEIKKEGEE